MWECCYNACARRPTPSFATYLIGVAPHGLLIGVDDRWVTSWPLDCKETCWVACSSWLSPPHVFRSTGDANGCHGAEYGTAYAHWLTSHPVDVAYQRYRLLRDGCAVATDIAPCDCHGRMVESICYDRYLRAFLAIETLSKRNQEKVMMRETIRRFNIRRAGVILRQVWTDTRCASLGLTDRTFARTCPVNAAPREGN